MTEKSKDKTKRKLTSALTENNFRFQTTFFVPIGESKETNTEVAERLRNILRKNYKFLMMWVIAYPKPTAKAINYYQDAMVMDVDKSARQAFFMVFSTERLAGIRKLDEIKSINDLLTSSVDLRINYRDMTDDQLELLSEKIKQKSSMTDLQKGFNGSNIRRYGLINKPKASASKSND